MAGFNNVLTIMLLMVLSVDALSFGLADSFKVVTVRADASGKGYIRFDQPLRDSTYPESLDCRASHPKHLAFDTNTPAGMAILSLALAAQATGKPVYATGKGECDVYGTVESWSWGRIEE
jgi:hypothetical protein